MGGDARLAPPLSRLRRALGDGRVEALELLARADLTRARAKLAA